MNNLDLKFGRRRLKYLFPLVALSLLFSPAVPPAWAGGLVKAVSQNPEAQKLIDQAWALQKSDYTTDIFKQCIAWMEEADRLDPGNPSILTDLSRYFWQYGDNLPKQTPEQQKKLEELFARGRDLAEKSIKIRETPDGHYWYAVNRAASLEFRSFFSQVAAFPSLYSQTRYVLKHDPDYDYGAPGRLWAEILARVPRKLVMAVGEKYVEDAVREIDKSISREPRFLDNYNYKARFMHAFFENREEALKLLDAELKMDPGALPDEITPNRFAQRCARQLWNTITGREYPEK